MVESGHWYLLRIKKGRHKRVLKALSRHGFGYFMPLCRKKAGWLAWKKYTYVPLIESFLFIKIANDQIHKIKDFIPSLGFVYWHEFPAMVTQKEVDILKRFVDDFEGVTVEKTKVRSVSVMEEVSVHVNEKDEIIAGELLSIGYRVYASLNNKRVMHKSSVTYVLQELTVQT